jgi:hypothetical protein
MLLFCKWAGTCYCFISGREHVTVLWDDDDKDDNNDEDNDDDGCIEIQNSSMFPPTY